MRRENRNLLNLPNALTILRLILIPAVCWLIAEDRMMPALALFVLASITDVVDGYIARTQHLITDFGKLMDPLADKLMVVAVLLSMCFRGIAPMAAIIILVVKELLMLLGGLLLYTRKDFVVFAKPIGKIAQFVTVLSLVLCFFHQELADWGHPIHIWLLWLGVGLSIAALLYYAWLNFFPRFRPSEKEPREPGNP